MPHDVICGKVQAGPQDIAELAERISQALRDEAELNAAVGRLLKPREKQMENEIATPAATDAKAVAKDATK